MRARRTAPQPPASEPPPDPQDRVDVSALGRELAEAELRTGDGADPRVDLIARLRAEVKDGTYRTDAQALAQAMLEHGDRG